MAMQIEMENLNTLAKNAGKLMRERWEKQLKSPKDPTIQSL
jgi:hypothetical protein